MTPIINTCMRMCTTHTERMHARAHARAHAARFCARVYDGVGLAAD
jgi:hypothetical protein